MQVKKTSVSETIIKFTISAAEGYLAPIKQATLQKLSGRVKVAGFREGKVPLNLVEKNLDQSVLQTEFLDEAMSQLYSQAVTEHQIRPVSRPKVSIRKFVPFTELEFEAEVEVIGEIKLADYKKIRKTLSEVKVRAEDVEDVLKSLRQRSADKKPADRPARDGDEVVIDFSGVDEKGEAVKGADGRDYPLLLGSKSFIPGFEDNLLGLKAGDKKTFTLKFPKSYGVKALAGKKVTFSVEIKGVNELIEDKLDDAFAQKIGPFKTLGDLKADIKKQLQTEREREVRHELENEIIKELSAKTKVSIPDSLLDEQVERLLGELKQNLTYRGQTYQEYLEAEATTDEKYRQEVLRPQAEERVKAGLALSEVAEREQLTVTPEELEIRLQVLKSQYSDAAMQAELDKPEARRDIASRLLTEKTIHKLVQYAAAK